MMELVPYDATVSSTEKCDDVFAHQFHVSCHMHLWKKISITWLKWGCEQQCNIIKSEPKYDKVYFFMLIFFRLHVPHSYISASDGEKYK